MKSFCKLIEANVVPAHRYTDLLLRTVARLKD